MRSGDIEAVAKNADTLPDGHRFGIELNLFINQVSISNFRTKLLTELECITCDSRRRNKANNTQVSFINLSVTLIVLVFSSIAAQFNMNLIKSSRLSRPRRLSLKVKRKIFSRTSF